LPGLDYLVALRTILDILMIGIISLVILALPDIIFGNVKKMGSLRIGGTFEGKPRKGLVQVAETFGKLEDDLHGDPAIVLNKLAVLVFLDRDEGHVRQCLGGFDVAVRGHGGNNAEKIAGAEDIPFLHHYFHLFGYSHLSLADNKKPVGILFAFDNDV
jgi:hypothetical protein